MIDVTPTRRLVVVIDTPAMCRQGDDVRWTCANIADTRTCGTDSELNAAQAVDGMTARTVTGPDGRPAGRSVAHSSIDYVDALSMNTRSLCVDDSWRDVNYWPIVL